MNRIAIIIILLLGITEYSAGAPEITFQGFSAEIIDIKPDKSTGLDHIYVARKVEGLRIVAPAVNGKALTSWQSYDNRGGGYAVDVTGLRTEGTSVILENPEGDKGYILTWPDATLYFWLTNYSSHQLRLDGVELPSEQDCDMIEVSVTGEGNEIHYYSINGRQMVLSRELKVSYNTLEWNQDELVFKQVTSEKEMASVGKIYISPPPYCDTRFMVSGDRFLEVWNASQQVESAIMHATAVDVHTTAERTNTMGEGSNQIGAGQDSGELGGSAPADVSFKAYVSDAVLHYEWQFSSDPQFEEITHRFNQQDLDYTFNEEGTTYVRFIGSNSSGSCSSESDTYTVQIGASELICPNAFSPGASEGVNDEWKVSYRSLIEFKCWIFDRYGTQLFHFTDPQSGWDGKYKGKYVKPGVYFYVIEALGSDGKKYKKSGDINILRYRYNGTQGGSGSN